MHRTTTTAALLVTVAASALSGCVAVPRPPAAVPPAAAPARPAAPRSDGSPEPQVVQAPAREALERVGSSRHAEKPHDPAEEPHAPQEATRPTARQQPAAPSSRAHPHPAPRHPRQAQQQPPRREAPDVTSSAPKGPGVCALGRRYGGWKTDSPAATICRQTYGR